MRDKEQCCGTCKHHVHESVDDGWIFGNPDSDYVIDWTDYGDWCADWEARERPGRSFER